MKYDQNSITMNLSINSRIASSYILHPITITTRMPLRMVSLLFMVLVALSTQASWRTTELFSTSNPVGFTNHFGLFIDPVTQVHHVLFHNCREDYKNYVFYKRVSSEGAVLGQERFVGPSMYEAFDGKLLGSADGRRLYALLAGYNDPNLEHRDLWYKESTDGGITWTETTRLPRASSDEGLSRKGSALLPIHESGRVFAFYSASMNNVASNSIRMVTKPVGSAVFSQETVIFGEEPRRTVRDCIAAEYSMKENKPVIHVVWMSGSPNSGDHGRIYYMRSENLGLTWQRWQICADAVVFPAGRIESAGNWKLRNSPVFLFQESTRSELWKLIIMKDHGASYDLVTLTNLTRPSGKGSDHDAGICLCGTAGHPLLYTLIDNNKNEPAKYQVVDMNTNKVRMLDHPFRETGSDSSGIRLACATDPDTGRTTVSAITEVGYNKPVRRLLMDTIVYKTA